MQRKTRSNPYWIGIRVVCGAALVGLLASAILGPGESSSARRRLEQQDARAPQPVQPRGQITSGSLPSEPKWRFVQSQEILEGHAKRLLAEASDKYKSPLPKETVENLLVQAAAAGLKNSIDIRHFLICSEAAVNVYRALSSAWVRQIEQLCSLPELSKAKLDLMWEVAKKKMAFTEDREVMHFIATSLIAGRYHLTDGGPSLPVIVNAPDAATRTIASEMHQGAYGELSGLARQRERAAAAEWAVDIGGNQGYVTTLLAGLFRNTSVVTVELVPANVVYVLFNLILNGFARELRSDAVPSEHPAFHESRADRGPVRARTLNVVNCAMTDGGSDDVRVPHNPKRIFHSNLWADFTPDANATAQPNATATVRVPSCTLPALLEERGIGYLELLKIDCEGCEYVAVPSWPQQLLRRVGFVLGELHGSGVKVIGKPHLQPGQSLDLRKRVDAALTARDVSSSVFKTFAVDRLAAGIAPRP